MGMGKIWNIKLKYLNAYEDGISVRERGYFKGTVFCQAFHMSYFHRPNISLQGTYANFYHHSIYPLLAFLCLCLGQFLLLCLCLNPS